MKLKTTLAVITTGLILLTITGSAYALSGSHCKDNTNYANKLSLLAANYRQQARQLNSSYHERYIMQLKIQANSLRAKAINLENTCRTQPKINHKQAIRHTHFVY
jgi:hypothetical protein